MVMRPASLVFHFNFDFFFVTKDIEQIIPPTLQVVHSRTFANAARTGGVGVRMLVPLIGEH